MLVTISLTVFLPPANPPFPVCDDFEPSGEQIGHDRPAGLHRLLLHHPQGEAQRDHAAQHRAEPRRLLQLDAQASKKDPKKNHMCISCASTSGAKRRVQSRYCQRVSLGLQHWRARMYLCNCTLCICANVQMYLCNPVTAVCAHARASNTFLCTLCAAACAHTVTAVPDPSAKNPVRVVKILT